MRIRALLGGLGLILVLGSGCSHGPASPAVPKLYEVQQQVDKYLTSGGYDRDFAAVVDQAKAYLEQRAKGGGKLAIVLDIDETSLSNWTAYKLNGYARITGGECNLEKGPCGLRAWQAMAQSPALKPTLELDRLARSKGVEVFFISGRPAELRDATERNLRAAGYDWNGLIIYAPGAHFDSAVDFKAGERKKLTEQGYTIVLNMGDQDSDLKGGFAERTFKLPNPVYFIP